MGDSQQDQSTILVTGCGEASHDGEYRGCPFHHAWEGTVGTERCDLAKRTIEMDDTERPEWCPLAKGASVLVTLRGSR
jgi:hypothetical protein